jgi:hypothetical protein
LANELWTDYYSGNLLDAYVFKKSDDEVFDEADGGNTFEVWQDGNVLNYDIPMTDQGDGYYTVDFPAAITGTDPTPYRVVIKLRVGANAAVGDTKLSQMEIIWDGSKEVDIGTVFNTTTSVTNVYNEEVNPSPITVIDETLRQ